MQTAHEPIPKIVEALGSRIVDAGFAVHRELGPGLLESVYEHCLCYELGRRGLSVERQLPMPVTFAEVTLEAGYRIDVIVEGVVIVEVKAVDALAPVHTAQLLTYLRLSGIRLGYLMNFNVALFKEGLRRRVL